jgi:hypothetical protein
MHSISKDYPGIWIISGDNQRALLSDQQSHSKPLIHRGGNQTRTGISANRILSPVIFGVIWCYLVSLCLIINRFKEFLKQSENINPGLLRQFQAYL